MAWHVCSYAVLLHELGGWSGESGKHFKIQTVNILKNFRIILGNTENTILPFPVPPHFHVYRSNTYVFIDKCNTSGIYTFLVVHNVEQWDNTFCGGL